MSLYGFSGFPMRDSLPRGSSFVYFMRGFKGAARAPTLPAPPTAPPPKTASAGRPAALPSGSTATAPPSVERPVPGGFDDAATETTLSRTHDTLADGTRRTDAEKLFGDGSRRSEVQHRYTDGTRVIETERRSLPDAEGFQKVRVWERTTAPDGSQSGTFRLFRVPSGMEMDWDAADAQKFMLSSNDHAVAPDGTILPDRADRLSETTTGADRRSRSEDVPAPRPRKPVIPLAP